MSNLEWSRRDFLKISGSVALRVTLGSSLLALGCDITPYGPLEPADENGIRLPPGFRSRVIARVGQRVGSTEHVWHGNPDGGATFRARGGWVYVSNSEIGFGRGGVGAIRFDQRGEIVDAYSILSGTNRNCAGGATPWGTWLSCEEVSAGSVYECDPLGVDQAVERRAMGIFKHEAVAFDPASGIAYLTEDERDGRLYRFISNSWGNLSDGQFQAALVFEGRVFWIDIPNPTPRLDLGETSTRRQQVFTTIFRGGEGIVYDAGHIYFTTKHDGKVWDYDVEALRMSVLYAPVAGQPNQLSGVDNITSSRSGDLLVAEDIGGNMEIVALSKSGFAQPLLRIVGHRGSEVTGPAFDPWGTRLYFSSQRGSDGHGITYEVSGPFRSGPTV